MKPLFSTLLIFLLYGCNNAQGKKFHKHNVHGEYIYRIQNDSLFVPSPPLPIAKEKYPWEQCYEGNLSKITKEFFRCKGNLQNPLIKQEKEGKVINYFRDCSGGESHGLPIRDEKEFIYPCLFDLLNYLQRMTHKKVVVTSGHRCPTHNSYCDYSPSNISSKHMLGAEVDFYVEGMEEEPEAIIALLQRYYKDYPPFQGKKEYESFQRYKNGKLNVSTPPWFNKEIFIKLYLKNEGRSVDNNHSHPFISIQVRHDRDLDKPVLFDAKQAQHYLRY